MEIRKVLLSELKPHPVNLELYNSISSEDLLALKQSLSEQGLLTPVSITTENYILSGHRRVQAALELNWKEISAIVESPKDERVFIVEANRYRRKTFAETMREVELLKVVESERAASRQGTRTDLGVELAEESGLTREKVAAATGIGSHEQLRKMEKIWESAKSNSNIAEDIKKIDKGETSVHSVYNKVIALEAPEEEFDIKLFNVWGFGEADPRFGIPYPGRLPGQLIANVIYYYSDEGSLVVDPMAGGGTTIDVCKVMKRRCIAYDVKPAREDIIKHDARVLFPLDELADLIFLDPPYFTQIAEDYSKESISNQDLDEFMESMRLIIFNCYSALKDEGVLAVISTTQIDRVPEYLNYIDLPYMFYHICQSVGFIPWDRIGVPFPTSLYRGFHVEMARETRRMLGILGDIIICRKIL